MPRHAVPQWIVSPMQGLAYWMGYNRALHPNNDVLEGAYTNAFHGLFKSAAPSRFVLFNNEGYRHFVHPDCFGDVITRRSHADMVIYESVTVSESLGELRPVAVLEVKRGAASRLSLIDDLKRLGRVHSVHQRLRAFLLVVSERHRPPMFVNPEGNAETQPIIIQGVDCIFNVRRVCKSAYGFEAVDHSDYVCLVEAMAVTA